MSRCCRGWTGEIMGRRCPTSMFKRPSEQAKRMEERHERRRETHRRLVSLGVWFLGVQRAALGIEVAHSEGNDADHVDEMQCHAVVVRAKETLFHHGFT